MIRKRKIFISTVALLAIMISIILLPVKITHAAQFEGQGTEESPYLIRTVEELCQIGYQSGYGCYKLMNDLDLENIPREQIIASYSVGGMLIGFLGDFDGGGHTIRGINIQTKGSAGLFGVIDGSATIKNLILEDPVIQADYYQGNSSVGVLCSYAGANTEITNCYIIGGNITGTGNVGGLIGSTEFNVKISQCYSDSNVNAVEGNAGGLVGLNKQEELTIDQCFALGSVKAESAAGGIIGNAKGTVKISNSYSINNLQAFDEVSGIGDKVILKNCYFAGTADSFSVSGLTRAGSVTSSYFNSTLLGADTPKSQARTTEQMYQSSNYQDWDLENIWYLIKGEDYPRLQFQKNFIGLNDSQLHVVMQPDEQLDFSVYLVGQDKILEWSSSSPEIVSVNSSGQVKALKEGNVTITVKSTDHLYSEDLTVKVLDRSSIVSGNMRASTMEGKGTEESPYLIRTVEDLKYINSSDYYKLMNDLDLDFQKRTPLYASPHLDGNGYTIKGLSSPLFSSLTYANIKNLNLKDVSLSGNYTGALADSAELSTISDCTVENVKIQTRGSYAGGLIGKIQGTNINNCYVKDGDLQTAKGNLGGLVGLTEYSNDIKSNLNQCYFTGKLTNTYRGGYTGGLAGESSFTNFNQCFAISEMNVESWAGGLVGKSTYESSSVPLPKLTDCFSLGSISSNSDYGNTGIIDYGALINCYSANTFNQEMSEGLSYSSNYSENCFFDATLFEAGKSEPQARTTEEMYNMLNYPWNFNTVWYIEDGKDYPRLRFTKQDADIPVIKTNYLSLDQGEQLTYSIEDENLDNHDMSWSSSDPEIVTVDQNGHITAVKAGSAFITAESSDHLYVEKIQVAVSEVKHWIMVELNAGETCRLEAEDGDGMNQRWTVKNPAVAAVSQNGLVTAVSPGLTKITARIPDGNDSRQLFIKVK